MKICFRSLTILSLLLSLLLYGCASPMQVNFTPQNYQTKPWQQRKTHLVKKKQWYMQGAVSIQVQNKTQMGSFTWQQQQDNYTIQLSGPLNIAGVQLRGNSQNVALWRGGKWNYANTPETLMKQQLGWYLPISNLYYWVRGLPAPGIPAKEQHDQFGHLSDLQQQGWQITYQAYQTRGNVDLPRKIYLNNQGLHAKLVIKQWQID